MPKKQIPKKKPDDPHRMNSLYVPGTVVIAKAEIGRNQIVGIVNQGSYMHGTYDVCRLGTNSVMVCSERYVKRAIASFVGVIPLR